MMSEEIEYLQSIDRRLKWILYLQVKDHFDEELTVKEKVKELNKMGFSNQEMAEVIGTTKNTVSKEKSILRKEGEIE
jgi:CRP-like cAMP-binding protein